MVLDKRVDWNALGGEVGNHVGLGDDDLSVQDIVVGVVAMVDHKGEIDHESGGVPLAIGAGVRLVGGQTVVGQKFVLTLAEDDDSPTGAFHFRGKINPSTGKVNLLILKQVRVDGERERRSGPVGVFRILLAALQRCQECY